MAIFTVNQNRQFYVANAYKAAPTATDAVGTIGVKSNANKDTLYFPYKGVDTLMRSDLIDIKNIEYIKATDADDMARELKAVLVTLDSNVNVGNPISGQDYLLRITFRQYFGNSDTQQYIKHGVVHAYEGMTPSVFYAKLAESLAYNFSREITKPVSIHLVSGDNGATDEGEVTYLSKFGKSATDSLTTVKGTSYNPYKTTFTGVVIKEEPQSWMLGTKKQVPVFFEVVPTTITYNGDEYTWGIVSELVGDKLNNGHTIADMEYFYMGERGDQYRAINWPKFIPTKYLVDPDTAYNTIDIHYSYVGSGVSCQKSEKDILIVVPKVGADNKASNALTNSILTAINTATGLTTKLLDVSGS